MLEIFLFFSYRNVSYIEMLEIFLFLVIEMLEILEMLVLAR